jgi:hypothetical protein
VRAAGTVEELEVHVHRYAVPAQPDRHLAVHPIEVQRPAALLPGGPRHRRARARRNVELRLHPGRGDLGRLLHVRRQHPVLDQEHVRGELRPLVPSPHLGDHTGGRHRPHARHRPRGHHDVIQLQVGLPVQGDPELQRGRVLGAEHPTDRPLRRRRRRLGRRRGRPASNRGDRRRRGRRRCLVRRGLGGPGCRSSAVIHCHFASSLHVTGEAGGPMKRIAPQFP